MHYFMWNLKYAVFLNIVVVFKVMQSESVWLPDFHRRMNTPCSLALHKLGRIQDLNKENWGDVKELGKGRGRAGGKGQAFSCGGERGEKQRGITSPGQSVRGL